MTDQRMLGLIMDDLRDQVMAPSATPLGWRLDAARWHLGQVRRALRGQVTDAPPWEDTITAMLNDQTPEAFERNLVILLVERHRKGRW